LLCCFSRRDPSSKGEKFLAQELRFIHRFRARIATLGNFMAKKRQIREGVLA
jgi:hypothetical protein